MNDTKQEFFVDYSDFGYIRVNSVRASNMVFQQALGQAHGNQGLSKYIITEAQVNNLTTAMNSAFGEPFYVLGNSQDISSQVLNTNPLETQDTYRVNGTMKGVGNISETGTYVSTYRPGTLHSVGSGTLSTSDGTATATFTAQTKVSKMPTEIYFIRE